MNTTYCDNCGKDITNKKQVWFAAIPFAVASCNVGESATLCIKCSKPKGKLESFRTI